MTNVSLQINFAPPDARYAYAVLPHQLSVWGDKVAEIVLTLDLRRSRGVQFGADWEEQRDAIRTLLETACANFPQARISEVDYSRETQARIATRFFGGGVVPVKDFRGGPYYSYFHGLAEVRNPYVLHTDADMLFGGMSQQWLREAVRLLETDQNALFINPYPGPPTADGGIGENARHSPRRVADGVYAFPSVSTRVFLTDLHRLRARIGPISAERMPGLRMMLGALRARRTTHDLPENVLTRAMARTGTHRLDVLGEPPGMWAIHPVTRDGAYYAGLATLVERVERGDVTAEQVGRYNLHPSMLEPLPTDT